MSQNLSGPTPEPPKPPNLSALAARVEALQKEISASKSLLTVRRSALRTTPDGAGTEHLLPLVEASLPV